MPHICVPRDSLGVVQALGGLNQCESASLRFSKLLNVPRAGEQTAKSDEIRDFVSCFNRKRSDDTPAAFRIPEPFLPKNSRTFALRLGGRLIVNHAGGVLENVGICLNRNFSCPMIPGSALKGVARHYAWELWHAETNPGKKRDAAEKLAETFGFPTGDNKLDDFLRTEAPEKYGEKNAAFAGTVAFLDAFPLPQTRPELDIDVCTCHHPDYYKPKDSRHPKALDDEDPNPQPFPVVDAGVGFCFRLVPLKPDADLDFAESALRNALTLNGVGAKTAAGYGWFEENDKISRMLSRAETLAASGDSALVAKILAMKNSELGDFLKKETISDEEKNAFKTALPELTNGQKNKLKELWKKGKGAARRNLSAILGDEAENQFT